MAYVNVNVDIDLDDINTDDLVQETCKRLRRWGGKSSLSDMDKMNLKEAYDELGEAMALRTTKGIEIKTLEDKMKYEHLAKVFNKYSAFQMEKLLAE